jgi:hypothetical protein
MAGGFDSLSGLWNGQFTFPRVYEPEFFTATLLEMSDFLGGSIQEVARNGRSKGMTLYATVHGTRRGSIVTFRKTYESATRAHSVNYEGLVNADGTEIEGTWRIPGNWSGRFLVLRDSGLAEAVIRRVAEKLPG